MSGKGKRDGILKKKSQFEHKVAIEVIKEDDEHPSHNDPVSPSDPPDKLEEEWRESFQARQRRRSTGAVIPVLADRFRLNLAAKRAASTLKKSRPRQDSSEYCKLILLYKTSSHFEIHIQF